MGRLFFVVSFVLNVAFIQAREAKDIQHGEHFQHNSLIPEFQKRYHFDRRHKDEDNPACKEAILCTDEGLEEFKPRFNKPSDVVMMNAQSRSVPYNATTYRGHPDCLCNRIFYQIISEKNNKTREPDISLFSINSITGEVTMVETMKPFAVIILVIEVMNEVNSETDIITLTIHRESSDEEIMDQFSPFETQGYDADISHSRHKRAISPTEVYLVFEQIGDQCNETRVGTRVPFRLNITFPQATTDMRIELFAPDNETTVMILCDVKVDNFTHGSNLAIQDAPIVKDSKSNDIIKETDHIIIDLGNVSVIDQNGLDNTLIVEFEAITIENPSTKNGTYYVTAGAEYGIFISVAQVECGVVIDGNVTVADEAQIEVDIPNTINVGTPVNANVTLYLPAPTRDYVFKVSSPPDTVEVMSVCALSFVSWGSNFMCGNNEADIEEHAFNEPQGRGTMTRTVDLKTLLNKGSRDVVHDINNSVVQLVFVVQLLKFESSTVDLVMALEIDDIILMVANHTFTVSAELPPSWPTIPVAVTTSLATPYQATIGESFSLTYTITIPSTAAAGRMILEVKTPFTTTAIFSVCSFKLISVGKNMPCLLIGDVETEYITDEPGGNIPHRASMDLGHVKNMQVSTDTTDNEIMVKLVLQPLLATAVLNNFEDVTVDVTLGTSLVHSEPTTIQLVAISPHPLVTNLTQPTFTMTLPSLTTGTEIELSADGELLVTMTTHRNVRYETMDMEFLTPSPTNGVTPIHICKIKVEDSGLNLPCLNPGWANNNVQYISTANSTLMDQAKLTFPPTCNTAPYTSTAEDKKRFRMYFKVLSDPTSTSTTDHILSSGVQFSGTKLWTGTMLIKSRPTFNIANTVLVYIHGTPIVSTNIPLFYIATYKVLYKIQPGEKVHLRFEVTSDDANLDICNIRLVYVGENLPCVSNYLSKLSYTHWGAGHRKSATMNLGVVNNYGDSSSQVDGSTLTGNSVEDENTISFNVYTSPGSIETTTGFTVRAFTDTQKTTSESVRLETSSFSPSAVNTTLGEPVQGEIMVGPFIEGEESNSILSKTEAKRILITLVIPQNSRYQLDVDFIIPDTDVGMIEICDAFVSSAGYNLPCVDLTTAPTFTYHEAFTSGASFSFPHVCQVPHEADGEDTEEANTIVLEAWVRSFDNGYFNDQDTARVNASVRVNGIAATMIVDSVVLQLTDDDNTLFKDKVKSNSNFIPEMMTDLSSSITMSPAEVFTVPLNLTITPYSSYRMLLDVDLPRDDVSACMTFIELRVINTGQNLLCFPNTIDASNKNFEYTPNVTDHTETGQMSYAFLNFGIITNTGKTVSFGTNEVADDTVQIEVEVQLADCPSAVDGASFNMSIGAKIINFVNIAHFDVVVNRAGSEAPDLNLDFTATPEGPDQIRLTAYVNHSAMSTAELWNSSLHVYLPIPLIAPENITLMTSTKNYSIQPSTENEGHLQIDFEHFLFSDFFDFEAIVTRNNSIEYPEGLSFDDSVIFTEFFGYVIPRTLPSPYEGYPQWTSDLGNFPVAVNWSGPGCNMTLGLGDSSILDCQIFSSDSDISPGRNGRYNSNNANYWRPYVRSGRHAQKRYLQVFLCNPARFTSIGIKQGGADKATELEVSFSDDFRSWFRTQTISNIPDPSGLVAIPTPVTARAIRIRVTNDTESGKAANLLLQFELYGCFSTGNLCPSICDDAANAAALPAVPADFNVRSMAEGYMGQLNVCDRDPDSDVYVGICKTTTDGTDWKSVDPSVAALIGYESVSGRMFAYGQDRSTVYYNEFGSEMWSSVDPTVLTNAKALPTFNTALALPEIYDQFFDVQYATPAYKTATELFGGTYDGVEKVGDRKILRWGCN